MQGLGRQLAWELPHASLMYEGGRLDTGALPPIIGDQGRCMIGTLRRAST